MAETKSEIKTVRTFNAPIDLVWKAWSDPKHLVSWWGPRGFRNSFHVHEFKTEGNWKFLMHGPDGTDYPNELKYLEIEKPNKIVLQHTNYPRFTTTVLFTDLGQKTKISFTMVFEDPKVYEEVKGYAIPGNIQTFDKLSRELDKMRSSTDKEGVNEFVLTRTFNAPKDLVWAAWTDAKHLAQWWGPKGCTITTKKFDLKPGGVLHYQISFMGNNFWGRQVYRAVEPKDHLQWINQFSNEDESLGCHPMNPEWPQQTLTDIYFDEQLEGQTTVTVHWKPYEARANSVKLFNEGHDSMNQGWGGSFDMLDEFLANKK